MRPEHKALNSAKTSAFDGYPIDAIGKLSISLGTSWNAAGGDQEGAGGVALGQFAHHPGDAPAHRREVVADQEVSQPDTLQKCRLVMLASLLRSKIGSSRRIIDSDLSDEARLIRIYNPHLHQARILSRSVENPAFRRRRCLDLSARSGVGLLPQWAGGTPETTFTRFGELLRRDRQGRFVIGVTDHQPVFEHDRGWVQWRGGLSTAAEGCQG